MRTKPHYIETTREGALAAPRGFIGIGAHQCLFTSLADAEQQEAHAIAIGYTPRWFIWSEDVQ